MNARLEVPRHFGSSVSTPTKLGNGKGQLGRMGRILFHGNLIEGPSCILADTK